MATRLAWVAWLACAGWVIPALGQPTTAAPRPGALLLSIAGEVEVRRAGAATWDFASVTAGKNALFPGDQLRTGPQSRATIRLADQTVARLDAGSFLRVLDPDEEAPTGLELLQGRFFFLHRDRPGRVNLRSATVKAAIEGTEFSVEVSGADGRTLIHLFDGQLALSNEHGVLRLTGGEASETRPGAGPVKIPMLPAVNLLQWTLYYPAVLDPEELSWGKASRERAAASLEAYRRGDLRLAWEQWPDPAPDGEAERIYTAALRLAMGEADAALETLDAAPGRLQTGPAQALRTLVYAVQFQEQDQEADLSSASSLMAHSYYRQSRGDLDGARRLARAAVQLRPEFGFALIRRAELEFAFGRVGEAGALLERGLALSPDHAQGHVLQGFVLAAGEKPAEALDSFNRAMELEAGLANAWLGRGLVRLQRGQRQAGREDLLTAAALEPQRAILRSYLGKALEDGGDVAKAEHELELARQLDPNDPTAWLYAALLHQRDNRINQAIDELETSQRLNGNRRLFRSRFLLDQDEAVRGANLASLYEDAGMPEVAYREAVHAVHEDYATFSSHLFLANSFDQFRDPRQVNLRYETPWLSEYLLANLLAPVGAGSLSQNVSSEEYSRLFERNRLGLVSRTEYRSNGDWLQGATQYGHVDRVGYAIDMLYRNQNGYWPNQDLEQWTVSAQGKVQLDQRNSLFLQGIYYDAEAGDVAPHYDPSEVNRGLTVEENQEPLLLAGYHHEWAPGVHTLALATRLEDSVSVQNPTQLVPTFRRGSQGAVTNANVLPQDLRYDSDLEIYGVEVQQIVELHPHRVILGTRYQTGQFETRNRMPGFFVIPPTMEKVETDFDRISVYGYYHWQVAEPLQLIAGLSYDRMTYPVNYRLPPVADSDRTVDQWSPKAGLIWRPWDHTVLRAAYARALGGVSIDQSFQLEPAHVAGFVQTYRSLIPEAVAGPVAAEQFDTIGVALDQKFETGTYLGLSGAWLFSEGDRDQGAFYFDFPAVPPGPISVVPGQTPEALDYEEQTLRFTVNQLLAEEWSVGLDYRLTHADLKDSFAQLAPGTVSLNGFAPRQHWEATLHQVRLYLLYQLACGWFSRADTVFSSQSNHGYEPDRPGDEFWQVNLEAGYRFARRRAELAVALLNVTDQDYRLNPLNLTPELPRERTLAVRFRFAF